MKKLLLLALLTCFSLSGFNQVLKGQAWIKPASGYKSDTINAIVVKNANTTGTSGFVAISGNDTCYIKYKKNNYLTVTKPLKVDTIWFKDGTKLTTSSADTTTLLSSKVYSNGRFALKGSTGGGTGSGYDTIEQYSTPKVVITTQTGIPVRLGVVVSGTTLNVTTDQTWFVMWGASFASFAPATYSLTGAWDFLYVDLDIRINTVGVVNIGSYTSNRRNPNAHTLRIIIAVRNGNSIGQNVFNYVDQTTIGTRLATDISDGYTDNYKSYTALNIRKDGTGDYLTIQAALTAITPTSLNRYELRVWDDYSCVQGVNGSDCQFYTKNFTKVVGMGGGNRTIYFEIPITGGYNSGLYAIIEVQNSNQFILENFNLIQKNGRYPVHADYGIYTSDITIINCNFTNLGEVPISDGTPWRFGDAWGCGSYDGEIWRFYNCTFQGNRCGFDTHLGGTTTGTKVYFNNCEFISSIGKDRKIDRQIQGAFGARQLASSMNYFEFNNCTFTGALAIQGNYSTSGKNFAMSAIPVIRGTGNTPIYYKLDSTGIGSVIRLVSNATGVTSNARITGGTALNLVCGGSTFVDGGGALQGTCDCQFDITAQTLGARVGNCTAVPKTLIIKTDSVSKTIYFRQDYTSVSNAVILDSMNLQLTTAKFISYKIARNYYPEISITYTVNKDSVNAILKGTFVKYCGLNEVRPADSLEYPDGMLLDNLLPSRIAGRPDDKARVLRCGYIPITGNFIPLFRGTTPTLTLGDKFIISSTSGKLVKKTTGNFVAEAVNIEGTLLLRFTPYQNK